MLVDGCASDHRWRPRARGYGSKSAAFSACLTPRHHQHTHSHGTTLPTPHLITTHNHHTPHCPHHILLHSTTHNHQQQQHPAILVSLSLCPSHYGITWLKTQLHQVMAWALFLPPRHFPSVNTFSAWSPCKEGQERGGLRADEGNCWSFTEC